MVVVFGKYLKRLETAEQGKPLEQRRRVPTIEDLAPSVGLHPVTLRNIANNNIKKLDLVTAGKLISLMRRLGFDAVETDVICYIPESEAQP